MDPPPPAQTETKKKKKRMLQSTLNGRFFQKNKQTTTKQKLNPKIFCDLDGVLVDFRRGVKDLTGYYPETHPNRSQMWQAIHQHESFYRDLNWTSDGAALWDALTPLRPNILTGVSHGRSVSLAKFEWCKRELNVEVGHCDMAAPKGQHKRVYHNNDNNSNNTKRKHPPVCTVITCWSKHKHLENRSGIDILIDDRPETLRDRWVGSGGTFVHHTSTDDTLRQLRVLGVFSNLNDTDNTDNQQKDDDKKESGTSETPFVKKKTRQRGCVVVVVVGPTSGSVGVEKNAVCLLAKCSEIPRGDRLQVLLSLVFVKGKKGKLGACFVDIVK